MTSAPLVPVRKLRAGNDSYGNCWEEDGSVVEVPYDQAMDLVAIPDGGFSVADEDGRPEGTITEPAPAAKKAVTEPAPRGKAAVSEAGGKAASK